MEKKGQTTDITVFTDPLCCWSWAFEAQLQQLKEVLGPTAKWNYCMGGLLPTWKNFYDEANAVAKPAQMGPVWMHAGLIAGKPIAHQLWMQDPPASSYPSCIAVKCVQLQPGVAGEMMLQLLRDSCMTHGKNIAKQEVIFAVADRLAAMTKEFDGEQFKDDYVNDKGIPAFRKDLELVAYYRINRFPAMVIRMEGAKPVIVSGYKQFEEVVKVMEEMEGSREHII